MCFKPVLSPSAIGLKRHLHRICILHFVNDNLLHALTGKNLGMGSLVRDIKGEEMNTAAA